MDKKIIYAEDNKLTRRLVEEILGDSFPNPIDSYEKGHSIKKRLEKGETRNLFS